MKKAITLSLAAAVFAPLAMAQPAGVPGAIADYWEWTRLNIDRVNENPSGAHPQPKDIYVNLAVADLIGADGAPITPFPEGTIIVKERNDANRLLVDRLYTMEKTDGDWIYAFYDRQADGSFVGQSFGAAPNLCAGCHEAADTDFVFTQFERR